MKDYEIITILPNDPGALEQAKKEVLDILKRNKVEVVKEDDWGVRKLTAPIDHTETAHFALRTCKADPAVLKTVAHEMTLQLSILRFMIKRVA